MPVVDFIIAGLNLHIKLPIMTIGYGSVGAGSSSITPAILANILNTHVMKFTNVYLTDGYNMFNTINLRSSIIATTNVIPETL